MSGIDPNIIVHEIKMHLDVKPVRKCLPRIHLKKVVMIKEDVEKLMHVGFIYPVPLTDWVSNIVPIMKK